jgi:AraC family transcriptional regulator
LRTTFDAAPRGGFSAARLRCGDLASVDVSPSLSDHLVLAYLNQPRDAEAALDGPLSPIAPRMGDVLIGPAGCRWRFVAPHGDGDVLLMRLSPDRLDEIGCREAGGTTPIALVPSLAVRDDPIARIARRCLEELQLRGIASELLMDSLTLALAVRLIRAHSTLASAPAELHPALASYRLKRATDYIEAHLADNISLQAVADVASLSTFHFARAFKGATGLSPYRFVIARRVALAVTLLSSTDRELSLIALDCGFSSQQQFTKMFRQATGQTPGRFREQARPR